MPKGTGHFFLHGRLKALESESTTLLFTIYFIYLLYYLLYILCVTIGKEQWSLKTSKLFLIMFKAKDVVLIRT